MQPDKLAFPPSSLYRHQSAPVSGANASSFRAADPPLALPSEKPAVEKEAAVLVTAADVAGPAVAGPETLAIAAHGSTLRIANAPAWLTSCPESTAGKTPAPPPQRQELQQIISSSKPWLGYPSAPPIRTPPQAPPKTDPATGE